MADSKCTFGVRCCSRIRPLNGISWHFLPAVGPSGLNERGCREITLSGSQLKIFPPWDRTEGYFGRNINKAVTGIKQSDNPDTEFRIRDAERREADAFLSLPSTRIRVSESN